MQSQMMQQLDAYATDRSPNRSASTPGSEYADVGHPRPQHTVGATDPLQCLRPASVPFSQQSYESVHTTDPITVYQLPITREKGP